jgi:hypothetical protein
MSKTQETKLAEQLANLADDHWFNPAIFGRYLAEQPLYTIDRVMEMVAHIISEQAKVYHLQRVRGTSSEGLLLANELNECIKAYQEMNVINNLTLPKSVVYNLKREVKVEPRQYGWTEEDKNPFDQV